jgi:BirA family biotin operon repressor/biotin-[acetyl-CoA-carboxylase] ligase
MLEELSPAAITDRLGTRTIGRHVLYYHSVTSTMDIARSEALKGAPEGTAIIADEQTRGRGRIKRQWFTPNGNIAVSVIFYPGRSRLHAVVMIASLAVAHSMEKVAGLSPGIKWPNDVLIGGKKVCGILTESDIRKGETARVIAGIGINMELDTGGMPEIAETATSISREAGRNISRLELLRSLLWEMDILYHSPVEQIYMEWRRRLVTLGKRVLVVSATGKMEGIAKDVAGNGSLLVRLDDGTLSQVVAGDVNLRDAVKRE